MLCNAILRIVQLFITGEATQEWRILRAILSRIGPFGDSVYDRCNLFDNPIRMPHGIAIVDD